MTTYSILLTLTSDTLQTLRQQDFNLYVFKAVRCDASGGQVLVWSVNSQYMENNLISWTDSYSALVAEPGSPLNYGNRYDVTLGENVLIQNPDGTGTVVDNQSPATIGLVNETGTQFQTGLAQQVPDSGAGTPWGALSVFQLYGEMEQTIGPAEKVLLAFSTANWQPGQALTNLLQASPEVAQTISSDGLLVDLESGDATQLDVSYVINQGWQWQQQAWGVPVPSSAPLANYLLLPAA